MMGLVDGSCASLVVNARKLQKNISIARPLARNWLPRLLLTCGFKVLIVAEASKSKRQAENYSLVKLHP